MIRMVARTKAKLIGVTELKCPSCMAPVTDIPLGNFIRCRYCGTVFMLTRDTDLVERRGYITCSTEELDGLVATFTYSGRSSVSCSSMNHITNARILPRPGRI